MINFFDHDSAHFVLYAGHTNVISYCCARFGQGSGPIYLDYTSCTGRESSLLNCPNIRDQIGNVASYCSHYHDVGVRCPCKYNHIYVVEEDSNISVLLSRKHKAKGVCKARMLHTYLHGYFPPI